MKGRSFQELVGSHNAEKETGPTQFHSLMYLGGHSQNQGESEVIDDTEGYRCKPGANGNHVSKTRSGAFGLWTLPSYECLLWQQATDEVVFGGS